MNAARTSANDSALDEMIRLQVIERGITDEPLLAAMRAVPRDRFFPPGTRDNVYADRAHSIGHGQTISQPYMVALMTARLNVQPGHRVLEIGTGTGYQTAILSKLVAEVFTIERIKPLLDEAFERLMALGCRNVHFRHGDGTQGWVDSASGKPQVFDRVLIAAAALTLPKQLLLDSLTAEGQAVLPIGEADEQVLVHVTRRGDELATEDICPCRFVRLVTPDVSAG